MSPDTAPEGKVYDVVVSVGTDHHPFDRLVRWADQWAVLHPDRSVFIQRGTSAAPSRTPSVEIVAHGELLRLFSTCKVVVSHGGPSTVMDARASGRFPVVVPRDPARGEHVDGHQMRFADHLQLHGLARLAASEHEFRQILDAAIAAPDGYRIGHQRGGAPSGVIEFGRVVDELLGISTPLRQDAT